MPKVVIHINWADRATFSLDDEYVVRRDGEKLGEQGGDFTPFVIELDGAPHVLVAGEGLDPQAQYVYVNDHPVRVNTTVRPSMWLAPPMPFSPGMTVTVAGKADLEGEDLWRLESGPLTEGANEPVLGPGWTRYAPLSPPSTS
jgi:hypothetical protein